VKLLTIIALIFSTLLVLVWPVIFSVTPFLFDSATGNGNDTKIGIFIMVLWCYPAGWIIALCNILVRRLSRSLRKWWEAPTVYLFLMPFAQLAAALLMLCFNFMGFSRK